MKIATSDQIVLASAAGAMGVRLDSFPAHAADTSAGLRETTSDSMIYPSHGAFEHSGSSAMFDIASEITQLQGVVAGPAALRSTRPDLACSVNLDAGTSIVFHYGMDQLSGREMYGSKGVCRVNF